MAVAAAVKTSAVTTDPGEETAQRTSDPSCHERHETAAAVADASSAADMAGRRIERAPVKAAATMTVVRLEVLGRCWTGGDGRTAAVAVRNGAVDVPALLRHLFASTVFQPVWRQVLARGRAAHAPFLSVGVPASSRDVRTVLAERQPAVAGLEVQELGWHHRHP